MEIKFEKHEEESLRNLAAWQNMPVDFIIKQALRLYESVGEGKISLHHHLEPIKGGLQDFNNTPSQNINIKDV